MQEQIQDTYHDRSRNGDVLHKKDIAEDQTKNKCNRKQKSIYRDSAKLM